MSTSLIIYGSLAPGESNHHIISHIPGNWQKATITGYIEDNGWSNRSGYPRFIEKQDVKQQKYSVHVFTSDRLPAYWEEIDAFEGEEDYKRIQWPYVLEDGSEFTGHIYVLK